MINDGFNFSKILNVSDIQNYDSKSRKIIWYIYAIRNYLSENDDKETSSLMCNRKIIEYISKYNFVPIRRNVDFSRFDSFESNGLKFYHKKPEIKVDESRVDAALAYLLKRDLADSF